MFNSHSNIEVYGGRFIDDLFPAIKNKIAEEISHLSDKDLSPIDDGEYSQTLYDKYSLDFPIIRFEDAYATTIEKNIPAEWFPPSFAVFSGKSYKKDVIVYHIPYSGDIDILSFKPNPFSTFNGYPFSIDRHESCFLFEVINFSNDVEQIKRAYEDGIRPLSRDYGSLKKNCEDFNLSLKDSILHIIKTRRENLSQKSTFLSSLGIPVKTEQPKKPIQKPPNEKKSEKTKDNYDLAISFAGEDRHIAEGIADRLKSLGYEIFYDKYDQANLWGKDLYVHLNEVYSKKAKFCLMIISKSYAEKHWTNHERRAAQARAFKQNEEYILPLRLDNTEIPGLNITVSYVDYNQTGLDKTINLLQTKIRG